MKRFGLIFCICLTLNLPLKARADLFGGDVAVLAQILANAVQQLAQLREILQNGKSSLELIEEINRGINDSLNLAQTMGVNIDPGIYRDWKNISDAVREVQTLYGLAVPSLNQQVQNDTDRQVAEAVSLNNSIYEYSREVDQIGEAVKQYSHQVSPGGAQKLTAQTLGVMLHVLNQGLRAQATGLKLQAQSVALENKRDKESTRHFLDSSSILVSALRSSTVSYQAPRF